MILLSLASKQIWPQVLAVLHARPQRLVLFHSDEAGESKRPAERLRDFFATGAITNPPAVELQRVRHDCFKDVVDAFANTAERLHLDAENCRVHLTGGNKLMAMAASEWCRLAGVPCFYLERDLKVFPFQPSGTDLLPQPDFKLDPHLASVVEPLALLRCQLDGADIVGTGQRLTLNEQGQRLPESELQPLLRKGHDFRKLLAWDTEERESKPGFDLEYATAFALLKLRVPVVQRSIRLAPRVVRGSGRQEGELDLVFNWSGKLWVVDCKDRNTAENKVEKLRTEILRQMTPDRRLTEMLDKLSEELRERDLPPLKEDLLAVAEVGGLLGQAICVRRMTLPLQAEEFANSRRINVVLKDRLLEELRSRLYPNDPASREQLHALATARTAAKA
jgi:hypothetical protein